MEKIDQPSQLYVVLKRIRYHHPEHELGGQIVEPGSEASKNGLPMDHLEPAGLSLLLRKRVIAPKAANKTD